MKVLFAVSSESISEAIIKRYQKEYKEILSYKNVYYFNAILKEIQKDKTYDRIIISEDLEPFSNNNYDTIDKFIFEKLDSISDEAQDSHRKETSIILICTDRRVKGSSILVKLFGIGVYNALLGNDRSMDEVCKLINRPRTKKEAKMYYRIDTEDVNYKSESENEVSEVEIQNILAHFKKLGKNTAKYVDSFNNIAIQYTDEQLRIIVNCLPINVKAVLEENSERYQQLMAVTGTIRSVKGMVSSNIEGAVKNEISERKIGQASKITKPIVIPSAVRNAKNPGGPIVRKAANATTTEQVVTPSKPVQIPVEKATENVKQVAKPINTVTPKEVVSNASTVENIKKVKKQEVIEEEELLLGFEEIDNLGDNLISNIEVDNNKSIEFDDLEDFTLDIAEENQSLEAIGVDTEDSDVVEVATKRGRGRPRKTPVGGVEVKPKGKRGRPRKIVEETEEAMLPGIEDDNILPGIEEDEEYVEDDIMLPGMEEDIVEEYVEDDIMLPGMEEDVVEEYVEDDIMLPGMEEDIVEEYVEDDTMLPGMEEDIVEEYVEDDIMLPGMEEDVVEEYIEDDTMLPGMEEDDSLLSEMEDEVVEEYVEDDLLDFEEIESNDMVAEEVYEEELLDDEYTEEVSLPGLDDLDDVEDDSINDEMIQEMSFNETEDEEDLLPGFTQIDEEEDFSDEGTLLPGMGFEDNSDDNVSQNYESNSLESIKPRVDYSMSSLNSLITKDKKIVTFIGTSKNGTSFLVNNLAALFSSLGINTAILDMTQNKNSYYIYTKNEEELRNIAFNSIEKLQNGYAEGIRVDKNLTVYTALPNDGKDYSNAEPILSTLVQNHSLVLIDCDYETDLSYFASCQEMYLVQSMDILTIQPLTAFLRELKTKGILEPEKIRVVINKELKVRSLSIKAIIGGLSYYNDPAMSFMTELFNRDIVKACTIPFEDNAYSKYLEGIVNCSISLNGYSKAFLSKLKILGDMVYPLTSKQSYNRTTVDYNKNAFSNSMNDTLNKMRKKY